MKLIECPHCHKLNPSTDKHRHLDNGVIEMGMTCQHCDKWSHFGYYNQDLIERRKQLTNRRRQRAYQRDYNMFQLEIALQIKM